MKISLFFPVEFLLMQSLDQSFYCLQEDVGLQWWGSVEHLPHYLSPGSSLFSSTKNDAFWILIDLQLPCSYQWNLVEIVIESGSGKHFCHGSKVQGRQGSSEEPSYNCQFALVFMILLELSLLDSQRLTYFPT